MPYISSLISNTTDADLLTTKIKTLINDLTTDTGVIHIYGSGSNGKSVFCQVLKCYMKTINIDFETLGSDILDDYQPRETVKVIFTESLNFEKCSSKVKQLIGSDDSPLWIVNVESSQDAPQINDNDGLNRRIISFKFDTKFTDYKACPTVMTLVDELKKDLN